ncbi:MAG: hypothetical protein AAB932_01405 [Patescibacteria group bacterium]
MTLDSLYLATWFQRTTLHLTEMYHFFDHDFLYLKLPKEDLEASFKKLSVKSAEFFELNDFDVVKTEFENGLTFTATDDGVMMLRAPVGEDLKKARKYLETFYYEKLGASLSYLFSRGAPLPKQLSTLKEVYPILLVVRDATDDDITRLFAEFDEAYDSFVSSPHFQIFFSDTIHIVRVLKNGKRVDEILDDLLRNVVFLREFERQLHMYLNLHRTMWDQTSKIRESNTLRYRDFPALRKKIMDALKTLSFVKARLSQMEDINVARRLLVGDDVKEELTALGLFRFDSVSADQRYIVDLWEMTIDYVKRTLDLLESLFQENTQRELNTLKFFTLIAAITSFFGMNIAFPWDASWPVLFPSSFAVVGLVASTCFLFYFVLKGLIYNRYFVIQEERIEEKKSSHPTSPEKTKK